MHDKVEIAGKEYAKLRYNEQRHSLALVEIDNFLSKNPCSESIYYSLSNDHQEWVERNKSKARDIITGSKNYWGGEPKQFTPEEK